LSGPEPHSAPLSPVESLARSHDLSRFDCGSHASLNDWLKRFAWVSQQSETSRTYVVHRAGRVVAFYSIAAGSVRREDAPPRVSKGLASHPVPIILLTRLAVDITDQGAGLGKAMLKDALVRIAGAADIVVAGEKKHVVMQIPKDGIFYVIEAGTGKVISARLVVPYANWLTGFIRSYTEFPIARADVFQSSTITWGAAISRAGSAPCLHSSM